MIAGISDARDRPWGQVTSSTPSVGSALMGNFEDLELIRIVKEPDPITFVVREVDRQLPGDQAAQGSVQPLTTEELQLKAEGERSWEWVKIYTTPDILMATDDVVRIRGTRFRIMGKKDWTIAGYAYYEAVRAFTQEGRR